MSLLLALRAFLRLAEATGTPSLVDLRQAAETRARLAREGFDLDQGMVVDFDGRRYGGGDAIHALALLSTPSGAFNRLNVLVFSNGRLARLGYPLLRAVRNGALLFLGWKPMRSGDDSKAPSLLPLPCSSPCLASCISSSMLFAIRTR